MSVAKFQIGTSANGIPTFSREFVDTTTINITVINTDTVIPVPPGATDAIVNCTTNILIGPEVIEIPDDDIAAIVKYKQNPETVKTVIDSVGLTEVHVWLKEEGSLTLEWFNNVNVGT